MTRISVIALLSACLMATPVMAQTAHATKSQVKSDPIAVADPFVGADGGGNTVPGAGIPFGFVSLSPDTTNGETNGYDSASAIMGFSFTHVTGTGGKSKYGNFRVTPTVGAVGVQNLAFAKSDETASPGYYAVTTGNHPEEAVRSELTATRLSGMIRVTYPQGQTRGNLILDATSIVALRGEGQRSTGSHVDIVNDHAIAGWASFEGGWNPAPYKLYFYAEFDRPAFEYGAWQASQGQLVQRIGQVSLDGVPQAKSPTAKSDLMVDYDTGQEFSQRLGAWASFDTQANRQVQIKLGVSFVSADKARANLESEIPDWNFDAIHTSATVLWRDVLDQIEIEGGSEDQRRIFYTALYRSHTMPHDLGGENVWWQSTEPHYEDYYTLWDTFRTLHPLLTVIQPQRQRDMIRSLLDTYQHTGWLPDARIAGANGMTQGGSNGDVVIADAVVKDLGGFDTKLAYEALLKDGEVDSDRPFHQGRVLKDYLKLGFVPLTEARSASRTLEYAYNDFAISEVAAKLGNAADAKRYLARSQGWKKLWDPQLGCIRPRYADGRGLENFTCTYDYPDKSTPWWEAPFYEGNGLQYSTYVPQDVPGLMAATGGRTAFIAWLDRLFDQGYYAQGNEPDILAPYLYIDAGRPDRTAERVRHILASSYGTSRAGLPGNDDAGAMSSWYVWSSIGLYPIAGKPLYYIGSPVFSRSQIKLESGRTFTVSAPATSADNLYVTGAKLNGRRLDRATLSHAELMAGGVLELEMGPAPRSWASATGQ